MTSASGARSSVPVPTLKVSAVPMPTTGKASVVPGMVRRMGASTVAATALPTAAAKRGVAASPAAIARKERRSIDMGGFQAHGTR